MSNPQNKKFLLRADEIRPLATGRGYCIATDMITVEEHKVSFMYREEPDDEVDSGWRFMSGFESQEYMDNPANLAVYDVNTIANYDSDIVPFLESRIGSAFERKNGDGPFIVVNDFVPPRD